MKKSFMRLFALLPALALVVNPVFSAAPSTKSSIQKIEKKSTTKAKEKKVESTKKATNNKKLKRDKKLKNDKKAVKQNKAVKGKSATQKIATKKVTAQKATAKKSIEKKVAPTKSTPQKTTENKVKNKVQQPTKAMKSVIVPKCNDQKVFRVLSDAYKQQGQATNTAMTVKKITQSHETQYYADKGIRTCHAVVETNGIKYATDYSIILNDSGFFVQVENAVPYQRF